jgi:hypothetical protein
VAIKGEHLLTEVGYDAKLQSGQDPGESMQMETARSLHKTTNQEVSPNRHLRKQKSIKNEHTKKI